MSDADGFGPEDLLRAVPVPRETAARLEKHRALLAAWVYYKRFAVSILLVEAGGDEAGR